MPIEPLAYKFGASSALFDGGHRPDLLNPAHIIRECLTDPDWGLGYQASDVDDAAFTYAADLLYIENFGLESGSSKNQQNVTQEARKLMEKLYR